MFLGEYVSLMELSDENMATLNQRLQPLIRLLESRYLIILDLLLGFHEKGVNDKKSNLVGAVVAVLSVLFLFCPSSDTVQLWTACLEVTWLLEERSKSISFISFSL